MASKSKEPRKCSYCQGTESPAGHNARTCPKRKTDEEGKASAKGEDKSEAVRSEPLPAVAVAASKVKASSEPTSSSEAGAPTLPFEYVEEARVVACNGTTIRVAVREYEGTSPSYILRIQKDTSPPSEQQFDHDVACRVTELMTWIVQRQTARRGLSHERANGSKAPRTEAR